MVRVQNTINGCWSVTDTVKMFWKNCNCDVFVPDAFSPNGDGVNDFAKPLKNCDDITNLNFSIFNRWGGLVFESKDLISGWDGFLKSEAQQMDSYIWTISYHDVLYHKDVFLKGVITLVR